MTLCRNRLEQETLKRARLAFKDQDVSTQNKNRHELQKTLDVCENLVKDLKYVDVIVKPCFPPEFNVMDLYIKSHEEVIMERLTSTLGDMASIVENEPEAVLDFNEFI